MSMQLLLMDRERELVKDLAKKADGNLDDKNMSNTIGSELRDEFGKEVLDPEREPELLENISTSNFIANTIEKLQRRNSIAKIAKTQPKAASPNLGINNYKSSRLRNMTTK